jgi:hypothetical protein
MVAAWVVMGFLMTVRSAGLAQEGDDDAVVVALDTGWMRRDWNRCGNPALWSFQEGIMTVSSDSSAVLYWQIPTRTGSPLAVEAEHKWRGQCDRPSLGFWRELKKRGRKEEHLVDAGRFRHVSWEWRIEGEVSGGEAEDVAEFGISVLSKRGDDLRELVYTWSDSLPENSLRVRKRTVVPRLLEFKNAETVVETGKAGGSEWRQEARDMRADFKRAFPREEPGRIARVYVKIPRDRARRSLKISLRNIRFSEKPPGSSLD